MSDIKWRTGNPPCNGNYLVDTDDDICVDYWFEYAWDDNKDKVNGWIPIEGDLVEQKHGHWNYTDGFPHWVYCSICYKRLVPNKEWIADYNIPTNYCPNCGAKMDELKEMLLMPRGEK